MEIAIVTGAASGVGLAVARKLVDLGYRVYGLGGNYQDTCPRCRRAQVTLAQSARVGGFG